MLATKGNFSTSVIGHRTTKDQEAVYENTRYYQHTVDDKKVVATPHREQNARCFFCRIDSSCLFIPPPPLASIYDVLSGDFCPEVYQQQKCFHAKILPFGNTSRVGSLACIDKHNRFVLVQYYPRTPHTTLDTVPETVLQHYSATLASVFAAHTKRKLTC